MNAFCLLTDVRPDMVLHYAIYSKKQQLSFGREFFIEAQVNYVKKNWHDLDKKKTPKVNLSRGIGVEELEPDWISDAPYQGQLPLTNLENPQIGKTSFTIEARIFPTASQEGRIITWRESQDSNGFEWVAPFRKDRCQ